MLFVLQDVVVVVASDVVAVDMEVALVGEPVASEEATQDVVPRLTAIKVEDTLDIPLASLKVKVKVVVRSVPTMGTIMVRPLNVSEPMMVATSMEEDIGLHSILPVDSVVTLSVIGILDALESEAVLITPIIIVGVMATTLRDLSKRISYKTNMSYLLLVVDCTRIKCATIHHTNGIPTNTLLQFSMQ